MIVRAITGEFLTGFFKTPENCHPECVGISEGRGQLTRRTSNHELAALSDDEILRDTQRYSCKISSLRMTLGGMAL
ncbi:MAG: hypothetical protein RIB15_07165 [Gracilimonas sp.]|uniref:hypothetical protein n=1 Tax=Gracilimonas sp. TaxID=1974203 RepID=UPI0032ECF1BD